MFLPNRPRPWKLRHDKELQLYEIRDANGKWIVNFNYYDVAVQSLGYMMKDEAEEAAKAFARLSRE